jgi:hypothetical protein
MRVEGEREERGRDLSGSADADADADNGARVRPRRGRPLVDERGALSRALFRSQQTHNPAYYLAL